MASHNEDLFERISIVWLSDVCLCAAAAAATAKSLFSHADTRTHTQSVVNAIRSAGARIQPEKKIVRIGHGDDS